MSDSCVEPQHFSGTYTPVFAGPALLHFLTADPSRFGSFQGELLMKSLPMASKGYLLRNTCTMLFYIYALINKLLYTNIRPGAWCRSDAIMMETFNGDIPASFYSYQVEGRYTKIPMVQAVADGLVSHHLNTYQILEAYYPPTDESGFHSDEFPSYYFLNIAALNYFSNKALGPDRADIASSLQSDENRQAMLNEHNIVKAFSNEMHEAIANERKIMRAARRYMEEFDRIYHVML